MGYIPALPFHVTGRSKVVMRYSLCLPIITVTMEGAKNKKRKEKRHMNKYYKKIRVLTDLSEYGCIVYCSEILQGQPHTTGEHLLRMVWIFHE